MRRLAVALGCVLLAGAAAAHDTWFASLPPTPRGEVLLALGTGNQFPTQETPVSLQQLQSTGCRGEGVRTAPLRWAADAPTALVLRSARPVPATASLTCWAQLVPIDIQIDDATVDIYLDEIKAPSGVRERWAGLKARGVRWQETYVKHARIELDGEGGPGRPADAIDGLGLDVRLDAARLPLRAGDRARLQVLRDGQPLAGMAVELRSDLSPLGLWGQTDADGRVELTVPLAARWILRGTDLRPSAVHPDRWDSRFVTLAFEVRGR